MRGSVLELFQIYLSIRKQVVRVGTNIIAYYKIWCATGKGDSFADDTTIIYNSDD